MPVVLLNPMKMLEGNRLTMKKFIASAGLVTLGTVSLQAAYAPGLSTMETSKPWSISASLRGFYDDNYNNAPSGLKKGSGGFEFSPTGRLNFPMEQTYIGLSALYSLKHYFDRPNNQPKDDHLFEFAGKVDHRFSERYKLSLDDSFVYTVEPGLLDPSGAITAPGARQNSDAIRNQAKLNFEGQLTELLGFGASYQNTFYDYLKNPDLEASLNRVEHLFDLQGTYSLQEHSKLLLGYEYGIFNYTSDKLLVPSDPASLTGNDRDNTSHYFYVGAEHAFSSQLNGTVRVGAQYTSYDHVTQSSWDPYADVRGTYTYLPGSYVQFGITHTRNATDVVGSGTTTGLVQDQESTTLFASVNHRITPRLTGGVLGQWQHSVYNGGGPGFDGKVDSYLLANVNLEYRFSHNWAGELGYNFDHLDSDLGGRSFSRNRVYGGVKASF